MSNENDAQVCPLCAGTNGNHGQVHERYGNGGGGNKPCPVRPGYHLEPGFVEPDTAIDLTGGVAGVLVAGLPAAGVKAVRVTATVTFEAYALTEGFHAGKSLAAAVSGEIADAIAYRAVHATDTEEGDALIAMTTYPDFAVDVRDIEVSVLERPVDLAHVVEQAEGTSGSW